MLYVRISRCLAAVLCGALLSVVGRGPAAHAYVASCRTDPVVTLSNGAVVSLSATIQTSISSVQSVSYVLHLPFNVQVTRVQYDSYGSMETLRIVQDDWPGHLTDVTTVTTGSTGVAVTATAQLSGDGPSDVNGYSGQQLSIRLEF